MLFRGQGRPRFRYFLPANFRVGVGGGPSEAKVQDVMTVQQGVVSRERNNDQEAISGRVWFLAFFHRFCHIKVRRLEDNKNSRHPPSED